METVVGKATTATFTGTESANISAARALGARVGRCGKGKQPEADALV